MSDEIQIKLNYFSRLKHFSSRNSLKRLMINQNLLELYKGAYKNGKKLFQKLKNFENENPSQSSNQPIKPKMMTKRIQIINMNIRTATLQIQEVMLKNEMKKFWSRLESKVFWDQENELRVEYFNMRVNNIFLRKKKYAVTKIKRGGVKKTINYQKLRLADLVLNDLLSNKFHQYFRVFFRKLKNLNEEKLLQSKKISKLNKIKVSDSQQSGSKTQISQNGQNLSTSCQAQKNKNLIYKHLMTNSIMLLHHSKETTTQHKHKVDTRILEQQKKTKLLCLLTNLELRIKSHQSSTLTELKYFSFETDLIDRLNITFEVNNLQQENEILKEKIEGFNNSSIFNSTDPKTFENTNSNLELISELFQEGYEAGRRNIMDEKRQNNRQEDMAQEKKDWLAISYLNFIENTNKQLNLEERKQMFKIQKMKTLMSKIEESQELEAEDFEFETYDYDPEEEYTEEDQYTDPKMQFKLRDSVDMKSIEELGASRNLTQMLKMIRKENPGGLIDIHEYGMGYNLDTAQAEFNEERNFGTNVEHNFGDTEGEEEVLNEANGHQSKYSTDENFLDHDLNLKKINYHEMPTHEE